MIQEYHCTFHEGRDERCTQIMSQIPRRGDWLLINDILYEVEMVTYDMRVKNNAIAVAVLIRRKTKQF